MPRNAIRLILMSTLILGLTACGQQPWVKDKADKDAPSDSTTPAPRPTDDDAPDLQPQALEDLPDGDATLTNLDTLIQALNLHSQHEQNHHGQGLTIAVLDNGFASLNHSLGTRLPPETELIKGPKNDMAPSTHGLKMAEIAYAVATGHTAYAAGRAGPKMLLINTNGFTNFRAAIDTVIERKVDIVLYAQVWEYGGNHDGRGFVNQEVQRAVDAGVLWLNAAGNFAQRTFDSPIALDPFLQVKLPYDDNSIRFTVPQDNTPAKIVLAWNDFADGTSYTTPQDLDLIVYDRLGAEVAASKLLQEGRERGSDRRFSAHAREIIKQNFKAGEYRIKVRAKSDNFDSNSRLRITIDGFGIRMVDRSWQDSLLIPADHPGVLAIGATDSEDSSWRMGTSDRPAKPDLVVPSRVTFDNGEVHTGTSAATAIVAGALAVWQSGAGDLSRAALIEQLQSGRLSSGQHRLCPSPAQWEAYQELMGDRAGELAQACATPPILRLP